MIDTEKKIWIVNVSSKHERVIVLELRKAIEMAPGRPVQLPWCIAQRYLNHSIKICNDPERYFKQRAMRHLTVRDAGIGDLILLEPCLRELKRKNNRHVAIASRYPDVYKYHPYIDENICMKTKDDTNSFNTSFYDSWDDLRNYSESCASRATKHRSDCYNEIYNLDLTDEEKQPRIYFNRLEKSILEKKEGYRYIGVNFDASHRFRKYQDCEKVVQYLLDADKKNIVVILGSYDYIKVKKNKRIIDYQGKNTIHELINIVSELDYLIAVDSGVMHIALATHTPVVCIFSIIKPELRLKYYKGHYRVIYPEHLDCAGCGSYHMAICKHEPKSSNKFIPPCMEIKPELMWIKLQEMPLNPTKRKFFHDKKVDTKEIKPVNIIKITNKKLTMPIIVQNEEHNLPRFIENVINHPSIGRVIAIDGGSTDNTVELLQKAGAEVYVHVYKKNYFNQQAIQREISFSYVSDNTPCIFFDIDECMNQELYNYLPELAENCPDYALIARKTFDYYDDIKDENKRIKDWPDYQPRVYRWKREYKFINGAHHRTINTPQPIKLPLSMWIIHFEKEGKDRDALEKQWSMMMAGIRAINAR